MNGRLNINIANGVGTDISTRQSVEANQMASLNLLAMPTVELEAKIRQEIVENPAFELDGPSEIRDDEDSYDADGSADPAPDAESAKQYDEFDDHLAGFAENPDAVYGSLASAEKQAGSDSRDADAEARREHFLDSIPQEVSLQESLLEQLGTAFSTKETLAAAEYIIGSLDERGYLAVPEAEIAQALNLPLEKISAALSLVQSFDPPGIAARDLGECLALQLERSGRMTPELRKLLTTQLDNIAANKLPAAAAALGTTIEELEDMLCELRTLNPSPGRSISASRQPTVRPDVTVEPDGDSFKIIEDGPCAFKPALSERCLELLESGNISQKDKEFIRERVERAKLFIFNLEHRKRTVERIARSIVDEQYDFMKKGPDFLRPLTMRQVADKLGVHETTVSRAVAGKYMKTPFGVFEFKYFFTGGFQTGSGDELSSLAVKNMIRDIVARENPLKPLSDTEISDALAENGVNIARRTVAKYRDELKIPKKELRKTFS